MPEKKLTLSDWLVAASNVASFVVGFLVAAIFAVFVFVVFNNSAYLDGYDDGEAAVVEALLSFGAVPLDDPTQEVLP